MRREAAVDLLLIVVAQVHVLEENEAGLWVRERIASKNLGFRALDVAPENLQSLFYKKASLFHHGYITLFHGYIPTRFPLSPAR